jgi:hypothetical protein
MGLFKLTPDAVAITDELVDRVPPTVTEVALGLLIV